MRSQTISFLILISLASATCSEDDKSNAKCELNPDPGACNGSITKYYFDKNEKKCKEFIWGGCGGVVPFDTIEECQKGCSSY